MCGITGYIGKKEGLALVFNALRKLEYRGYDSSGVAYFGSHKGEMILNSLKRPGKLDVLSKVIANEKSLPGTGAIAHTRWATHGVPNEANAHPHSDCKKEIFLVHNGIIENYRELKSQLKSAGHKFKSETDTEVVAHLIEENLKVTQSFEEAFAQSLKSIRGAYALAVIFKAHPHQIYFARLGSPLVLGVGDGEYFLASDPTALAGLVKKVVYLKDGQRGKIALDGMLVGPARPKIESLELNAEGVEKGGFPHFMLKEIFEGPEVVEAAMRGRLSVKDGRVKLGGLQTVSQKLQKLKKIEILSCGTSYYSGMIGKLLFEEFAGIPAEILLASEYRYQKNPILKGAASLFISQSGETADTLAALKKAAGRNYLTLGIVNAVGSTIARDTDAGVYNHAGPEIGVASTKAFLSQVAVLALMSLYISQSKASHKKVAKELSVIPKKVRLVLNQSEKIKALSEKYSKYKNFLYIGRGYNYPVALEGALKLKEISYAHAEGYAGGEMKHGPIALIDKNFPTVAIVTKNKLYEKLISNLHEIKARGGPVLAIATSGDKTISSIADDVIYVPETLPQLEPLINTVPLQLFAYHYAVIKGCDVDKPRNLAKSVTVE